MTAADLTLNVITRGRLVRTAPAQLQGRRFVPEVDAHVELELDAAHVEWAGFAKREQIRSRPEPARFASLDC